MKRLFMLLPAVLVASCGTTELSRKDQSDFKAGRKAIVKTYNQPLLGAIAFGNMPITQIIAVDGKKLDSVVLKTDEQIAVDIGMREIEFACVDRSGPNEKDFREVIKLDAKPYHEYQVRCSFDSKFGSNGAYEGDFEIKEMRIK